MAGATAQNVGDIRMSRLNRVDPKDPDEIKLYTMNWAPQLPSGATVSSSTWTLPSGLTQSNPSIVTGSLKTSVLLGGGVDGQDYEVLNEVVTSDGETLRQAGVLPVRKADRLSL
jgi:hypothetical protein